MYTPCTKVDDTQAVQCVWLDVYIQEFFTVCFLHSEMKGISALLVDGEWYTLITVMFTITGQNLGSGAQELLTHISIELCMSKDEQVLPRNVQSTILFQWTPCIKLLGIIYWKFMRVYTSKQICGFVIDYVFWLREII